MTPRRRPRRRWIVAALVLFGVASAVVAVVRVMGDPIRYGLGTFPLNDGATVGEAYLDDAIRDAIRSTGGPYRGPDVALDDLPRAVDVPGAQGQPTSAEVLEMSAPRGSDFRAEAWMLWKLTFRRTTTLIGASQYGEDVVRCRVVTVRYDGVLHVDSARAPCPSGVG